MRRGSALLAFAAYPEAVRKAAADQRASIAHEAEFLSAPRRDAGHPRVSALRSTGGHPRCRPIDLAMRPSAPLAVGEAPRAPPARRTHRCRVSERMSPPASPCLRQIRNLYG